MWVKTKRDYYELSLGCLDIHVSLRATNSCNIPGVKVLGEGMHRELAYIPESGEYSESDDVVYALITYRHELRQDGLPERARDYLDALINKLISEYGTHNKH